MMSLSNKLHFLLYIDLFGKIPKLYYKGKEKRKTFIGSFATVMYVVIYICFFVYKINKMMSKTDISYYETYLFEDGVPSIELTNENYYGGFALQNPLTSKAYIDETIYYPKGYYRLGKRGNDGWIWEEKELELERCKLEKFGSHYKEMFKDVPLENYYCLKEVNVSLDGYKYSDIFSYFMIKFNP